MSAPSADTTNWLIAVSAGVTSSAILYAVRALRGAVRKFGGEHKWLMETTASNTAAIKQNSDAIAQQGEAIRTLLKPPARVRTLKSGKE